MDRSPAKDTPLDCFGRCRGRDWLRGGDRRLFERTFESRRRELETGKQGTRILLVESQPEVFLGSFLAACTVPCFLFLGDPQWGETEWQQAGDRLAPDCIWSASPPLTSLNREGGEGTANERQQAIPTQTQIAIPTGGSSGRLRFAVHTWQTLSASVGGFADYFEVETVNSFCTLPLHHVSGLMQFLRSLLTGGSLVVCSYKKLLTGDKFASLFPGFVAEDFFISLVPTQLQRLLENPELAEELARFKTVLLGGAPAWPELLEVARQYNIRLSPTYGSTETAAQIVTLKSEDFLTGNDSCGRVLPHARVEIKGDRGATLAANQIGRITVRSPALCLGYDGEDLRQFQTEFDTDDLGYFDDRGYLYIVGRASQKIVTGGENVFPAEIEAAVRSSELGSKIEDICIVGLPDRQWGQIVVALYVPKCNPIEGDRLKAALAGQLARFKHPKYWMACDRLPRNNRGKLNVKKAEEIALNHLSGRLHN